MSDLQQQLTELRQQNEQLLAELRTLTSEFHAFRAEVMGERDPHLFEHFAPNISDEEKEQVIQRFKKAVKAGTRSILTTANQLEEEHLIQSLTISSLYREMNLRFGLRSSLSALKTMQSRMSNEHTTR